MIVEIRLDPQALTGLQQLQGLFEDTVEAIALDWLGRWSRNPPPPPDANDPETFTWVTRWARTEADGHVQLRLDWNAGLEQEFKQRTTAYRIVIAQRLIHVEDLASAVVNAEGIAYATLNDYTYGNCPPRTPWRGRDFGPH